MYYLLKNRKSISLIAFVAMCLCINTYASDSDVEEIRKLISGNSLKIINRLGSSIIYFEPSGSFKHLAEQGQTSNGKWRVTTDSMCATVLQQPIDPPKEFCINLKNREFGESWIEEDPRNGELKRTLIEGHPKL